MSMARFVKDKRLNKSDLSERPKDGVLILLSLRYQANSNERESLCRAKSGSQPT